MLARSSGLYLCDWKIRKKSEPISNLENRTDSLSGSVRRRFRYRNWPPAVRFWYAAYNYYRHRPNPCCRHPLWNWRWHQAFLFICQTCCLCRRRSDCKAIRRLLRHQNEDVQAWFALLAPGNLARFCSCSLQRLGNSRALWAQTRWGHRPHDCNRS